MSNSYLNNSDQGNNNSEVITEEILNSTINEYVNGKSIFYIDISIDKIDMIDQSNCDKNNTMLSADEIIK